MNSPLQEFLDKVETLSVPEQKEELINLLTWVMVNPEVKAKEKKQIWSLFENDIVDQTKAQLSTEYQIAKQQIEASLDVLKDREASAEKAPQ
jgi:hypothetical protein